MKNNNKTVYVMGEKHVSVMTRTRWSRKRWRRRACAKSVSENMHLHGSIELIIRVIVEDFGVITTVRLLVSIVRHELRREPSESSLTAKGCCGSHLHEVHIAEDERRIRLVYVECVDESPRKF